MNVGLPRFLAQRTLHFWALLGAATFLALTAIEVAWRFWPRTPETAPAMPPVLRPNPARAADVQRIVQAHLFGQAETPAAKVAAAPDTRLRLRLVGVMASPAADQARAMIAADGGRARGFAVGQPITGTDAILHAIEDNRVLIRRGGAIEQLKLERKTREAAASDSDAPTPRAGRGVSTPPVPAVSPSGGNAIPPVPFEASAGQPLPEQDTGTGDAEDGPEPEPEPDAEEPGDQSPAPRARARK